MGVGNWRSYPLGGDILRVSSVAAYSGLGNGVGDGAALGSGLTALNHSGICWDWRCDGGGDEEESWNERGE